MKIAACLVALSLLIWSGCASRPKVDVNKIDWNSRVGNYTYEQAVSELGKPDVLAETSEGTSADWVTKRSPNVSFGFGVGHSVGGGGFGSGVGVGTGVGPRPHGEYLHLNFGKDGRLASWSRVKH